MKNNLPPFLLMPAADLSASMEGTIRESFLEKGINSISHLIQAGIFHVGGNESSGLFQVLDTRIKLAFLLSFLIVISLKHSMEPQLTLTGIITAGLFSRVFVLAGSSGAWFLYLFFRFSYCLAGISQYDNTRENCCPRD